MSTDSNFQCRIVFRDERVFHVSVTANRQNIRNGGIENPWAVQKHEIRNDKIAVWCAIYPERVLDPYYFNNKTV